jgi:hypothetical protein
MRGTKDGNIITLYGDFKITEVKTLKMSTNFNGQKEDITLILVPYPISEEEYKKEEGVIRSSSEHTEGFYEIKKDKGKAS